MSKSICVAKNGAVTTVILDRRESANTLDRAPAEALIAFAENEAVRWGAAGNFSAGIDLAVTAVLATGGGLELALWCDLRIAEGDAVYAADNCRSGLPLMDGGTVRLPRLKRREP